MVVNASKFQVILLGLNSNENIVLEVGGCSIGPLVLPVVLIYLVEKQSLIIYSSFITPKFNYNYCSLIWMFC